MNFFWIKAFTTLGPSLIEGIRVVVNVTIFGFAAALIMSLLLAIGRMSKNKAFNKVIVLFIELIRGTPLLVQFFYIYYVIPMLGNGLFSLFGITTDIQI